MNNATTRDRAVESLPAVIERLKGVYPDARYELDWENPLQLLVATILAAQCTDERVNQVTPGLFTRYPDAAAYADADLAGLEEALRPTGFYRQKARTVQAVCRELVDRFGGEVPRSMEELTTLPGVARKTANVVLNNAFRIPSGVIVDTHVARVAPRLGLTDQKKPEKIERDLMELVPREEWITFGPALVLHGRYTCTFHAPRCEECVLNDLCPRRGVGAESEESAEEDTPEEPVVAAKKTSKPSASAKKKTPARKTKAPPAGRPKPTPAPAPSGPSLADRVPAGWREVLAAEFKKPSFKALEKFLAEERSKHQVFPPEEDVFNALQATPFDQVQVVLLGQDPYHDDGQAHGMAFSVRPDVAPPPSLVNIFKELQSDVGCKVPNNGYLEPWARQGVLLLNTVLTVRAHEANSHKDHGWENFTDAIIAALGARQEPVVFLLWGANAQKKTALIDAGRHVVLAAAHPSPLSAKKFFGSKPFSAANQALQHLGRSPIDWQLPDRDGAGNEIVKKAPAAAPPAAPPKPAAAPAAAPPVAPSGRKEVLGEVVSAVLAAARPPRTDLEKLLPADWQKALAAELGKASFAELDRFLARERQTPGVLPASEEVFRAFQLTPYDSVRVVLMGPEPHADERLADGLACSVRPGARPTMELADMFEELRVERGCRRPVEGSLAPWARQGVLLLNAVLTTRAGKPGAHRSKGWESFTDAVLRAVNARPGPVVYVLSGAPGKKAKLIDNPRHVVLDVPGLVYRGSGLFTAINDALELRGASGIYWQLPYV